MLRLKDAIDKKSMTMLQQMLMQFLHSSTALYEFDGAIVYSAFESPYCNYLSKISCEKHTLCSKNPICRESCCQISRESMDKKEPLEKECPGGINIYAVPIIYSGHVIGSINAGITNPPSEPDKIESISKVYGVDADKLLQSAQSFKKLTDEKTEAARLLLNTAAHFISCLYGAKVNQLNVEEKIKQKEKQLEETNEQLDAIFENVVAGIIISDAKGTVVRMNRVALQIHGISSLDENLNVEAFTHCFELLDLDGSVIPLEKWPLYRIHREGVLTDLRLWVHNKSTGIKRLCSHSGTPVYNADGELSVVTVALRDITEQIEQHEQLLTTEREKNDALKNAMKMKDEFIAFISHEFKTPLTVINSAIQAMELLCKNDLSPKSQNFINTIRQNSFRQLRLVNNLLDITRINSERLNVYKKNLDIVYITKAIVDSVHLYSSQKDIKLSFVSSISSKIIGIDEEKYERILLNLLSNAIKFTPAGRSVTVFLRPKKSCVCIEVKDTGPGIPKDKQELIFERFGQVDSSLSRQAEGTGIGLSLVKKMVKALGGNVILKSQVGEGSTFKVLLPVDKVSTEDTGRELQEINDGRLIKATAVEFSNIYID